MTFPLGVRCARCARKPHTISSFVCVWITVFPVLCLAFVLSFVPSIWPKFIFHKINTLCTWWNNAIEITNFSCQQCEKHQKSGKRVNQYLYMCCAVCTPASYRIALLSLPACTFRAGCAGVFVCWLWWMINKIQRKKSEIAWIANKKEFGETTGCGIKSLFFLFVCRINSNASSFVTCICIWPSCNIQPHGRLCCWTMLNVTSHENDIHGKFEKCIKEPSVLRFFYKFKFIEKCSTQGIEIVLLSHYGSQYGYIMIYEPFFPANVFHEWARYLPNIWIDSSFTLSPWND